MPSGIDSATSALVLAAMNGGAPVTFTGPLKCLWLTAVRTADNLTDTEVPTSLGYTAGTGFSGLTFAAAVPGAPSTQGSSNVASVVNMPACTWAGNKIVDSSGTPKTTFYATLIGGITKAVNAGDTVAIPIGSWATKLGQP